MNANLILAQTWGWGAWGWLVLPLASYGLISLGLFAFGHTDETNIAKFFFRQISDSLERVTGFPGWSMGGVLSGLLFLLILVIGFYWDVGWHIDNGRDTQLFTPAHVMILVGLGGLIHSAAVAVLMASFDRADVGVRAGPVRVPWSALLLLALGVGGIAAFPLDNLWHHAYGIDVTLWSPTHLQLVSGGVLATVALWLMIAEATPPADPNLLGRGIQVLTAGTILVGLSAFQGEFDFGVPQFQVLYLPLLMMAAAGLTLVATRMALGPWGAMKVVLVYLVLRGFLAAVVGGAFHHTVPRFPLYLPCALVVEAAAWKLGTERRLRLAVVAGGLMGTVGVAGELAWVVASGWAPSLAGSLAAKTIVLAPLAAVSAAVLGAGLARAFCRTDPPMPLAAFGLATVVLAGVLLYPLPRRAGDVVAVVRLTPAGSQAVVEVRLEPPGAAHRASAFAVSSWQGGGTVTALLDEVGPGRYRSSRPVPITGRWKTVVALQRGDEVMAAPVYLPADPEIGASAVPALPERRVAFQQNVKVLLREAHGGPAWPAVLAYSGLALLLAVWGALISVTVVRVSRPAAPDPRSGSPLLPPTLVTGPWLREVPVP